MDRVAPRVDMVALRVAVPWEAQWATVLQRAATFPLAAALHTARLLQLESKKGPQSRGPYFLKYLEFVILREAVTERSESHCVVEEPALRCSRRNPYYFNEPRGPSLQDHDSRISHNHISIPRNIPRGRVLHQFC